MLNKRHLTPGSAPLWALLGVSGLFVLLSPRSSAQEALWPDYRGPGHDGQAGEAALPLTWSETSNISWKTPLEGRAWSSPVISEEEIWLTNASPDGAQLSVLTVSLESGELLRDQLLFEVAEPQPIRNKMNSYASPSAVLEGGRVYVHFGTAGSACLDEETGQVLWKRSDINCEHLEGPGSSPIIYEGLLIFHVDGADVQFVIALDKETGKTVWKSERSSELAKLPEDLRKAYSTPILLETEDRVELISTGAARTFGYDPKSGKELWHINHPGFSMSARPVTGAGHVFINTGYMRPQLWAITAGGSGDVTESHVAWKFTKRVPTMSSAILVEDLLFMANDAGIATCLDAKNGELLWQERIGGEHSASPIHANGRVYFFDREGRTRVLAASKELKLLAENTLDNGFYASPAVAGKALILRTTAHLYRVED